MTIKIRIGVSLVLLLATAGTGWSQQAAPPESLPANRGDAGKIHLTVAVTPKSGAPVTGLSEQDFKLMDNKRPTQLTSFKVVSKGEEPVRVILLIDAVNIRFTEVAFVRDQVMRFLKADGGVLSHPTTIAVLTDKGTEMSPEYSKDGNLLSASLDHYTIGLREITRSTGIWGANDRVQISLTAIGQLAAYAGKTPGRTIVLWISPGWPLLSGPRIDLSSKQQEGIFGNIVGLSTQLRQANVTIYNVNPLGANENLIRADYYQAFLKGVSNPYKVDLADLSLQVLAIQSGGLVFDGSTDVAGILRKCFADTESWYEVTFDAAPADKPNEYHHVEVTVDKPGLIARTRDGYYAQP